MRVVADTNTVVSGLLWSGPPREVLDAARAAQIQLFTTLDLLVELEDVLKRPKFGKRRQAAGVSTKELILGYSSLALLVRPAQLQPVILADPDDDAVLACAVAALAQFIVSGDNHLLELSAYQGIEIVTAPELLRRLAESTTPTTEQE